ncbi:hypothetical protein ET445_09955 [Agromyces protaetiae]|uniref:Magnesium transporter n=1 Tax=Agromyces protaetiae TaxID=2509455 RepID=A0A4P6FD38_9MICO|nr:CorA family divalent cation transporter [Agromyces protaetiae]QAY73616.1 hypothetical protein ET445_09955 [Agromyces protaetiae]
MSLETSKHIARDIPTPTERHHAPGSGPRFQPIRLVNPDRTALERVQDRISLHPLVVDDLLEGRQHPKFENLDGCRYLTIWDVDPGGVEPATTDGDLAFVFDERELLIVQRGPANGIRDLDVALAGTEPVPAATPISALYRVLDAVVHDFIELGADVERELDEVEAEVFDSRVREDYRRIYRLRQRIGRIDRAASGLADALLDARREIEAATSAEPELRAYFTHLEHDVQGVAKLAADEHAALDAVVSSHQSNVATRQNQDMRTISAFAALLAIPTVIAGVYGMNFKNLPMLHWEFGWIGVVVVMLALDLVAYLMFRRRGWLGGVAGRRHDGDES